MGDSHKPTVRGRGAQIQPANPYLPVVVEDDLEQVAEDQEYLASLGRSSTEYLRDDSQTIVAENHSPDISFRYSINPYRGCAHGCSYCYARPTHEFFGFSAGLDFETKVLVKHRAPELFKDWLARPQWEPEPIAFSGVTDCYQPIERKFQLTRACLRVALECHQPVTIVTKNALITRDLDILRELAERHLVRVAVSTTTLDSKLAGDMEPRTSTPAARLRALEELAAAGVSTIAMVAPVIPGLNDSEIPEILRRVAETGAEGASFVLLRLPTTVQPVFFDWLERHRPNHKEKVVSHVRSTRGGKINESRFGHRMRGTGVMADQIKHTFQLFARRYALDRPLAPLNCTAFRHPIPNNGQLRLFD